VFASPQRVCRLAHEAADADDALRALETLVELRRELGVFTREQVARGLGAGRSFGEVARALGISRQAAHRHYRELAPASGPRVAATEEVHRVLRLAQSEAGSTRAALGSEHVMIAVLLCGGAAAETLIDEGATLERVRASARAVTAESAWPSGFRQAEPEVRALLREAVWRAISRGERWLNVTGLLLAALADPDGGARRVLATIGVDVTSVRARLEPEPALGRRGSRAAARTRRSDVS